MLKLHESGLHDNSASLKVPAVRHPMAKGAASVTCKCKMTGEGFALFLQLVCCLEPLCRMRLNDASLHRCGITKPTGTDATVFTQFLCLCREWQLHPSAGTEICLILRVMQRGNRAGAWYLACSGRK